jgi:hypothetical protein
MESSNPWAKRKSQKEKHWSKKLLKKVIDTPGRILLHARVHNKAKIRHGTRGRWSRKMEFGGLSEEKLGQLMTVAEQRGMTHAKDVQDALAELLARKAVGESLMAFLNKETSRRGDATLRSATNFWANHVRRVKDL